MPHRVIRHIDGHRGSFLLVGGLAYIPIGLSYLITLTRSRQAGFAWLPEFLTPSLLGWVWLLAGATAVAVAFTSRAHPKWERHGFSALITPPVLWSLIFLIAWLHHLIPALPATGHPTGYLSVISYGLMAGWVGVASGWDEPVHVPPLEGPDERVME